MDSQKPHLSFLVVIGIVLVAAVLAISVQNSYSTAGFAASESVSLNARTREAPRQTVANIFAMVDKPMSKENQLYAAQYLHAIQIQEKE